MSKNTDKIRKALEAKGYKPGAMIWESPRQCDFGADGGWYIEVFMRDTNDTREDDDDGIYVDTILAFSTAEAIEEIDLMPAACEQEVSE